MKTLVILLIALVVVFAFVAHTAEAGCDFNGCWVTCQREHSINFRRAFCDGGTCKCVF
ncbi:hypothetical protein L9F63_002258, partial [Diploptera punctata]